MRSAQDTNVSILQTGLDADSLLELRPFVLLWYAPSHTQLLKIWRNHHHFKGSQKYNEWWHPTRSYIDKLVSCRHVVIVIPDNILTVGYDLSIEQIAVKMNARNMGRWWSRIVRGGTMKIMFAWKTIKKNVRKKSKTSVKKYLQP